MKEQAMDSELEHWRAQWLAHGDDHELAYDLQTRAKRDAQRLRLAAAVEVAACGAGALLLIVLIVRAQGRLEVAAPATAIIAFYGAWLAQFFAVRRNLFAHAELATDEYMQITYKRLDVAIQWNTTTRRWITVLAGVVAPWCAWISIRHVHTFAVEPWRAIAGFGSVALIFVGSWFWTQRKRALLRRDRATFDAIMSQINT
jgi:hypothetical protein